MMSEEDQIRESLTRRGIPEGMHWGVAYLLHRLPPSDFLYAVVTDNLSEAYGRADEYNQAAMHEWVKFFYNDAPAQCWGSPEKVSAWLSATDDTDEDAGLEDEVRATTWGDPTDRMDVEGE